MVQTHHLWRGSVDGSSHGINLSRRDSIGGISEAFIPSAAALAVFLIAYTCKGGAALAAFQRLTHLVGWRRWR